MSASAEFLEAAELIGRECVAVRLRILNRAVSALFDDALRPYGLRIGQANILVVVARLGSAHAVDLCRILRMDKSTLSRDVAVLRRRRLVEVDPEARGRARPVRLTAEGRAFLTDALPAWRAAQAKAKSLLGDATADAVARSVDKLWAEDSGRA